MCYRQHTPLKCLFCYLYHGLTTILLVLLFKVYYTGALTNIHLSNPILPGYKREMPFPHMMLTLPPGHFTIHILYVQLVW